MMTKISRASKAQIGAVLDLMLAGVSSDPASINALGQSWWRRLIFRRIFGPRMLHSQMETFVATRDDQVVGYLVLQFEGETAGTFDWAVTEPLDGEGIDTLGELIETALDHIEERGHIPLAYFGMARETDPRVAALLEEMGFWLADYQLSQMRAPLPLAEPAQLPAGIRIKPQIAQRFSPHLCEFIRMDFDLPDDKEEGETPQPASAQGLSLADQVDALCDLHQSTLRASKLYVVEEEGEAVGLIQKFTWKDELRLLVALEPFLWGTETEQQVVAAMPGYLDKQSGYLRVRTFSSDHLNTSRESLEALGLVWQEAPWQRWIVGL